MRDVDRRRYLALLASGLAGTAGCLGDDAKGPSAGASTETPNESHRETSTPQQTDGVTKTDGLTETDEPTETPTPTAAPESLVLELVDPSGAASGVYEVSCEAGIRYEMLLTAEPSDPPEDASVTPVSSIPEQHRELVVDAITGEGRPSVYPESESGEWVRTQFFGEYVSYEGTIYQGAELEQTDTAFFSTTAWYILSLTPVEEDDGTVTLRLADIDPAVRASLDTALGDWRKDRRGPVIGPDRITDSMAAFAGETDGLLIHTHAFDVRMEHRS